MASGHTGNVVPGNRLRVRVSCPPLSSVLAVFSSSFLVWESVFSTRGRVESDTSPGLLIVIGVCR